MSNEILYAGFANDEVQPEEYTFAHQFKNSFNEISRALERASERAFMWFHIRQSSKICRIEYILLLDSLSPIECVFNCKRENQIKMNLIDFNWNVRDFCLFLAVHNPHFKFGWEFSNICFNFFSGGGDAHSFINRTRGRNQIEFAFTAIEMRTTNLSEFQRQTYFLEMTYRIHLFDNRPNGTVKQTQTLSSCYGYLHLKSRAIEYIKLSIECSSLTNYGSGCWGHVCMCALMMRLYWWLRLYELKRALSLSRSVRITIYHWRHSVWRQSFIGIHKTCTLICSCVISRFFFTLKFVKLENLLPK